MFRESPSPPPFPYTTLFRSVYDQLTRKERHEQLIRYAVDGAVEQVRRAHDLSGGQGAININVLWEMGGAQPILEARSEEHTSELQSRGHLVCRLLLEKKKRS